VTVMAASVRGRSEREGPTASRAQVAVGPLPQRLLSPQEAARYLGLGSRWAVRRLVVNGELPVVKLAGKWRLDREDLDRLIAARKSGVQEDDVRRGGVAGREQLGPFPRAAHRRGDGGLASARVGDRMVTGSS